MNLRINDRRELSTAFLAIDQALIEAKAGRASVGLLVSIPQLKALHRRLDAMLDEDEALQLATEEGRVNVGDSEAAGRPSGEEVARGH